ncbi:uncharacterized protein LOC143529807 [Bidens hawaiensis]|uniref:uncharacterized protein LOC143529807 n=1 Tax=Bidens hawaiensis TaxID=980011 RepID=UPI00404A3E0B
MREFFAYRFQDRINTFSLPLNGRRLFQQLMVDVYTIVESERLFYIRNQQKKLRCETYENLRSSQNQGNNDVSKVGQRIILPSSFTGSSRYMLQNYLDAMSLFVYTVEFQKRGLPHAHLCLFMNANHKLPTVDHVDPFISTEIPDKNADQELYYLVKEFMIHGPYGIENINCPCMVDRKCSKNFPKKFREFTSIDGEGYHVYRRRDDGRFVDKLNVKLDNRSVVPYNKTLLKRNQAHINVEWCNQAGLIKYLFKYINKGQDRVSIYFVPSNQQHDRQESVDEIKEYYSCRYISACEASWRIFSYDIHYRNPSAIRIPFHLSGQQVIYEDSDVIDDVLDKPSVATSMFLEWMNSNQTYPEARKLSYVEYPTQFVWKIDKCRKRRKKGFSIGRIYVVSPSLGEAYYLRILLNKVKGQRTFDEIKTFNNVVYPTFRDACYAYGLLDDDNEYVEAISEASFSGTGYYL